MTSCEVMLRTAAWDRDRAAISAVRREVFCEEQGIAEELDFDGSDTACAHVLAITARGDPVGTGRIAADGTPGRVAVLKAWRGRGIGTRIMQALLDVARARGQSAVSLHAQLDTVAFYEKLGFRRQGEVFIEAGIPHVTMVRRGRATPCRS
jgi:predicted GNAT family N-acyltransferase